LADGQLAELRWGSTDHGL